MICEKCGAEVPENTIRCIYCGQVLQMVPDYNPLGDVIEDEVRSAININPSDPSLNRRTPNRTGRPTQNTGRVGDRSLERARNTGRLNERNTERPREGKDSEQHRKKREQDRRREIEKRREMERRRAQKIKQRNILIGSLAGSVILIILIIFMVYNNSYNAQISKGWKAADNGEFYTAVEYFEKAIEKKPEKSEAYIALSDLYFDNEDMDLAESILLEALALYPDDLELNEALIKLYVLNDEMDKINAYMDSLTNEDIIDALDNYQSEVPEFSLSEGIYEDVQELTITSAEEFIYYTLDGSEASVNSQRYTSAIQIGEGTTTVRAISVNSEGVPSFEMSAEYTVEFPMESAPVVSPTTGQYTEETLITVTVPAGYTAYYTLDNTTPTKDSTPYTGEIDMPEGNTIFTVILMNSSGKYSDVTKRNYDLVIEEETEEEI